MRVGSIGHTRNTASVCAAWSAAYRLDSRMWMCALGVGVGVVRARHPCKQPSLESPRRAPLTRQILAEFLVRVPQGTIDAMRFPHETARSFGARVLRARKYDLTAAIELVNKTVEWRRAEHPA